MSNTTPVLDACCGSRAMWFDRHDSRCLYIDKRKETHEMRHSSSPRSPIVINPDIQCDFTALPFDSGSFGLVVFDPPHVIREEARGNVTKFYGVLNGDWKTMIRRGFEECFRVLRPGGVLIFKWTETQIPLRDILALTPEKPLFGHKSGAKARTHWCTFMKPDDVHNHRASVANTIFKAMRPDNPNHVTDLFPSAQEIYFPAADAVLLLPCLAGK